MHFLEGGELARPELWDKILRILEDIKAESDLLGIPTIDVSDGLLLEVLAFHYALKGGNLFGDFGAGIGYSTAWIALGVEAGCKESCRVVAVEYLPGRAERLRVLGDRLGLRKVEIEVREADALKVLKDMPDNSLSLAFIDIDKHLYVDALRLLEYKLEKGGVALFHNAFYPRPPNEFFKAVSRSPWKPIIAPSTHGMVVAVLE